MKIKEIDKKKDLTWIKEIFKKEWSADFVVSKGKKHYPQDLLGIIAEENGKKIGLLTYEIINDEIELVSLNSFKENHGVGSILVKYLTVIAKNKGCRRIFVLTDNSNLRALGFYQKRGFVLKKIYPNSFDDLRKLKPQIPKISENGIPLRDEIELEYTTIY
jgi:N-acetylglutamate synthase-like GNAT family acetyltransferase